MIELLQFLALLLVAIAAPAVVLTGDSFSQAITISLYGLLLALLFFLYQAPDVALSQIAVGAIALPLMILLSLARIRTDRSARGTQR